MTSYVRLVSGGQPLRLTTDPADDILPTWSPDGKWIATDAGGKDQPPGIYAISVDTGERQRLTSHASDSSPAFSPAGNEIVFVKREGSNAGQLFRQRLGSGMKPAGDPEVLTTSRQSYIGVAWMPDGQELVFSAGVPGNMGLYRMKLSPGAEPVRVEGAGSHDVIGSVTVSRRGTLALTSTNRELRVVKAELVGLGGPVRSCKKCAHPRNWTAFPPRLPTARGSRSYRPGQGVGNFGSATATAHSRCR